MNEQLIKASQSATLLLQDIRDAHKIAIDTGDWAAEILLLQILGKAAAMQSVVANLAESSKS